MKNNILPIIYRVERLTAGCYVVKCGTVIVYRSGSKRHCQEWADVNNGPAPERA